MEPAQPDIRRAIQELGEFPLSGTGSSPDDFSDNRLCKGHPLYDAVRTLLTSIEDVQLDRNGDRNFPGNGGRLWYKLLRDSRKDGDHEQLLVETADSFRRWLLERYSAKPSNPKTQHRQAIEAFSRELERYEAGFSASDDEPVIEPVVISHPLNQAATALTRFYPSEKLPLTARHAFRQIINESKRNENFEVIEKAITDLQIWSEAALKSLSEANLKGKQPDSTRPQQVILLVHGIRTYAEWQPMVRRVLEEIPGTLVVPLKYEWFDAFRFWLPYFRTGELENIHRKIRDAFAEYRDVPISIIAHSFGTHAIGELLKDDPQFRIQRLVLCGSILPRSFKWDLYRLKVESEVINDRGSKDIWPVLARSSSWGYGDSGTHGFGAVKVHDRAHNFRHSDYFKESFVREFWLPWFQSGTLIESEWDEKEPPSSWWRVMISLVPLKWILVILLLSPVAWGVYVAMSRSPASNHTIRQPPVPDGPLLREQFEIVATLTDLLDRTLRRADESQERNRQLEGEVADLRQKLSKASAAASDLSSNSPASEAESRVMADAALTLRRAAVRNSLAKIFIAIEDYLDVSGKTSLTAEGDVSWRTSILPFFEATTLFENGSFSLDERLRTVFCLNSSEPNDTSVVAVKPEAHFNEKETSLLITDGTSNTIMAIVVRKSGILPGENRDFARDEAITAIKAGNSPFTDGTLVLFRDGNIRFIVPEVNVKALEALIDGDGSIVIREDRPDPPEDIPSMDPELNRLTNADRDRSAFQNTSIIIFNNSNKTVRLAYTNIPQPDGRERSVYGHRESGELLPGQTIEDHEVSFGGPYHISVFADGTWTKMDRWYDLGIIAKRQIVVDNASGAFRCTIHFPTEE